MYSCDQKDSSSKGFIIFCYLDSGSFLFSTATPYDYNLLIYDVNLDYNF